jgi:hypothetical protein
MSTPAEVSGVSDLSRRILRRREELGLTSEEVARRAGVDPSYLDYFERNPVAVLSSTAMLRLARALETTPESLTGADVDRPSGTGQAGPHPVIETMSDVACIAHLAGGGVGRIVFNSASGPVALPVNYRFVDGQVAFRTQANTAAVFGEGKTASFEVDHIDETMSEGWSVLVTGRAREVTDPALLERFSRAGIEPWAGGEREAFVCVDATEVSGRCIRQE